MAKRRFGTNAVSGLNLSTAAHLIADHELVSSVGGWTDQDGAWRTAKNHVTIHSGSAISAMAVGRMGGQDHTVYIDGNSVYDTGSLIGTVTMGSDPRVVYVGGKFLILGAADGKNRIYSGLHLRDHGPWISDMTGTHGYAGIQVTSAPATYAISNITKATNAKVYLSPSGLSVGMPVYISGVVGMTEINDTRAFTVVSIDPAGSPAWITIDCDSSGFTAYSSGGTLYRQVCGIEGTYKFMATTTITLQNGSVLESAPMPLGRISSQSGFVYRGDDGEDIALTPLQNVVFSLPILSWILSSVNLYNITGTIGTDFYPGLRLYRTKVDGSDYYLEKEWKHGDSDFTYNTGVGYAYYSATYFVYKADADLGALYTAGPYDHGSAPQSSLAAQVGQRVFVNDVDNPTRVYVSGLDGPEYFSPVDWLVIPDDVTVLERVRDRLVVGTAARWYLVDMISGFPQVQEIDSSTGTIYPDAISVNDQGLFFVKPEGIFHLDLVKTSKISRRAISDTDLAAGQAAIVTADHAIFICDPQEAGQTAVANINDGGWTWHTARETLQHLALGKDSSGNLLGALPTKIEMLFIGTDYAGSLQGKVFSDGQTWQPIRLLLDIETTGAVDIAYNVQTNRGAAFSPAVSATLESTKRRIVDFPMSRKPAETFQLILAVTGNATLYGYAIEVES